MELNNAAFEGGLATLAAEMAITVGAALIVLLAGGAVVWRCTRSVAWRCAAVPVLALGSFAAYFRVPIPTEEGTWACDDCGGRREELRVLDRSMFVSPIEGASERSALRAACTHEWRARGCHHHGRDFAGATMVSCSFY